MTKKEFEPGEVWACPSISEDGVAYVLMIISGSVSGMLPYKKCLVTRSSQQFEPRFELWVMRGFPLNNDWIRVV